MPQTPTVTIQALSRLPALSINWDAGALILTADLVRDAPSQDRTLSNVLSPPIDADRRIVVGDMDVTIDGSGFLAGFEIRSNPARWQQAHLRALPERIDGGNAEIGANFDENGIASFDSTLEITLERDTNQLSFVFGRYQAAEWTRITEGLFVGRTRDDMLAELRLLDFSAV